MSNTDENISPPNLATRFFRWYCQNELQESILGDLQERFEDDLKKSGKWMARLNYYLNVLKFINRYTLRKKPQSHYPTNYGDLLRSNLLTSLRYLKKHRGYTAINIVGLTAAMSSCLFIALFIGNELSFDHFHLNAQNIYRVATRLPEGGGTISTMVNTPPALAPSMPTRLPEVKSASRLRYTLRSRFNKEGRSFYEDKGFYADSLFLEIFSFELLSGDIGTALDQPNSIVMTEQMASRYFTNSSPVGELITMNGEMVLEVTGILKQVPANSHIDFDYLVSFSTYRVPDGYTSNLTSWRWLGFLTYVELVEGTDPAVFQSKLDQIYLDQTRQGSKPYRSEVQALPDIYLSSTGMTDDLASPLKAGNKLTIYALAMVATLIMLIAGFNFMNLTTAISVNRGKEVGLRKIMGANKLKIIFQLLTESMLIAITSLVFAVAIVLIFQPYLTGLLGWNIEVDSLELIYMSPVLLIAVVLLGFISGSYPSILLAKSDTIAALKNNLKVGKGLASSLRNTLVVLQFGISLTLIAATLVITRQINFMRDQSLGFDQENIITIKLLPSDMTRYYETFRTRISQHSEVISVSRSERLMGDPWPFNSILIDGQDRTQSKRVIGNLVGYDYLKTMGIKLKEGRSFSRDFANDSLRTIIISEKTAQHLGLNEPIGEKLRFFSLDGPRTVIGVMEDFHFSSLHEDISPVVFIMPFIDLEHLYIRVTSGNVADKMALVRNTWDELAPGVPLDIRFMDDQLQQLYAREERLSSLITCFSMLAVLLACLGLYGLVTFMVNNRIKEVGVRKVLGASVYSLMLLFSRNYLFLIVIASILSVPVTSYLLGLWLENFAYRITIPFWIYAMSSVLLAVIALITLSHQVIKAGLTNPVKVLRSE